MKLGLLEKFKWGLYGSVGALIISSYYLYNDNFFLGFSFLIISVFIPFTESTDTYNSMLWGKKLFNVQAKYNVINILVTLMSVSFVLYLTNNIYLILLTYLLSLTIPNLFFLWNTNKYHKSNDNVDEDAVRYGKTLSFIGVLALLFSQLDKILVFHYIGPVNLAIYSLAVAPTDQIKGLMKNLNSLAMPQLSNRTIDEIKKNIPSKIGVLLLTITSIVIVYILLAPLFFKMFFPKYLSSVIYTQILSLSLIPVVIAGFIYTILESQKSEKKIYQYNIYGNIFGIIILFPLVYYGGIWGAIFSRILTRCFFLIHSIYLLK
jgi:O-antigen/teichoic acid export membrane protein